MPTKIDQKPAEVHVEIYQGDSWELAVTVDGIDLTDYSIAAAIHPKDGSADVALAIEDTDLANGQYKIRLSATDSAALPAAHHSWCHVLTPPRAAPDDPAFPRTFFAGRFIVGACS